MLVPTPPSIMPCVPIYGGGPTTAFNVFFPIAVAGAIAISPVLESNSCTFGNQYRRAAAVGAVGASFGLLSLSNKFQKAAKGVLTSMLENDLDGGEHRYYSKEKSLITWDKEAFSIFFPSRQGTCALASSFMGLLYQDAVNFDVDEFRIPTLYSAVKTTVFCSVEPQVVRLLFKDYETSVRALMFTVIAFGLFKFGFRKTQSVAVVVASEITHIGVNYARESCGGQWGIKIARLYILYSLGIMRAKTKAFFTSRFFMYFLVNSFLLIFGAWMYVLWEEWKKDQAIKRFLSRKSQPRFVAPFHIRFKMFIHGPVRDFLLFGMWGKIDTDTPKWRCEAFQELPFANLYYVPEQPIIIPPFYPYKKRPTKPRIRIARTPYWHLSPEEALAFVNQPPPGRFY